MKTSPIYNPDGGPYLQPAPKHGYSWDRRGAVIYGPHRPSGDNYKDGDIWVPSGFPGAAIESPEIWVDGQGWVRVTGDV